MKPDYLFIVWDKAANKYAGSTRFDNIIIKNKTLSLGFMGYGNEFQGIGINKHCKCLLLEYAFETRNIEGVAFRADHTDLRSIATKEHIKERGRSELLLPSGRRSDTVVLRILREVWILSKKDKTEF